MPIVRDERVINGTVNGASVTHAETLPHRFGFAVQVKWSGSTITGSAKLQGSLNGEDYEDIENSEIEITTNSGSWMWNVGAVNFKYLKIVCTSTTGSITFQVWLVIKKESQIS